MVQESLELIDVVVQHGHQVAGRALFEVAQVEVFDVVEGVNPKIVLNRLGEVAPGHPVEVLEERFQRPDDEGDDGDHDELGPGVLDAERGQERILLVDDDVHRHADQERWGDVHGLVEHGPERGPDDLATVAGRVVPEPPQRRLGGRHGDGL